MDEAISVAVIIDKLPPSWKEFKHGLKHKKEELNLVQLGSHLRIEEGLRNQELDNNPKGKNQIGSSSVNMTGHMKKDCRSRKGNGGAGSNGSKDPEKQQVCKSIEDGSFVKMGNVATEPIKGIGRVLLTFTRTRKAKSFGSDFQLYLVEGTRDKTLSQREYCFIIEEDPRTLSEAMGSFVGFGYSCGEYYDPVYFQSTGIIHQTTAPYTPQQNGVAKRKNGTLKEMVNSMLSYSGLSEGFWGEAMFYMVNRTPNNNSKQTPYEIWTKKIPNLTYLRVWGCRAVVRLTEPRMKNLGEKESRDAIFDEERFTSIPRPRGMIQPSSSKIVEDEIEGTDDVPVPSVPRKSTRTRKAKSFGSDFQLYLVEGTRDKTLSQREYCFIIEEDPRTLSEAMASRDVAF
ncbi:zinc finger, CCHC-type containing protein [Tanacetum coccineum]